MWDNKIIPDYIDRVDISGFSRTGKSTHVHRLTDSVRVTFHENMPLEDFLGGMQLVNGSTIWVDGPCAKAMREGRILQIDELMDHQSVVPQEVITTLYAAMDKPAAITLPTGERLVAKKGYAVIATHNPPPDRLPHPIFDRFDVFLKADKLSKGMRAALGNLATKADNVVGYNQPKLSWTRPVTVNALLALTQLRKAGVQDQDAAHLLGFTGNAQADFLTAISDR